MTASLYGASAEYALHSLLILSARGEPVSVRDLAHFQELPMRFLAKLFARLQKAGLVVGREGIHGGYDLAHSPERISVLDVVDAPSIPSARSSRVARSAGAAPCSSRSRRPGAWPGPVASTT